MDLTASHATSFLLVVEAFLLFLLPRHGRGDAMKKCGNCGNTTVPYPLSTGPDCGDRDYQLRCRNGTLWLGGLNDTSYTVTSIDPLNQRLTIRPPGFADGKCLSYNYRSDKMFALNETLPFNISTRNTILLYNCLDQSMDSDGCPSTGPCYTYARGNRAASPCLQRKKCCSYKTGSSHTDYKVNGMYEHACLAFQSFVNLDDSLPVSKWPEPGLEIMWASPSEPECRTMGDCVKLQFSSCLTDPTGRVERRCLCNDGFVWDSTHSVCQDVKCMGKKDCNGKDIKFLVTRGLALSASAFLLGALIGAGIYAKHVLTQRQAYASMVKKQEEILNANLSGKSARIFPLKEIEKATCNFAKENLLGVGGFGEVFKGILDDGTILAVKRAKLGSNKGMDQLLNEVRTLCQVNHRSLVRLLGCCIELHQPLMIYEYIQNGTLFDHLYGHARSTPSILNWHRRLIIAHQAAEGLAYLHFSAKPPIYHRDIKSSNILLDEKFDAKVSDFGLSKLVDTNMSHISTCARGTLGYLDPDYYLNFQLTDKSDVYSFGVVLLELLTSKMVIDFSREEEDVNLVAYVKKMMNGDKFLDVVEPNLREVATRMELESMKALGCLAMSCLDERRENRPAMKEVAEEIEYILGVVTGYVGSKTWD